VALLWIRGSYGRESISKTSPPHSGGFGRIGQVRAQRKPRSSLAPLGPQNGADEYSAEENGAVLVSLVAGGLPSALVWRELRARRRLAFGALTRPTMTAARVILFVSLFGAMACSSGCRHQADATHCHCQPIGALEAQIVGSRGELAELRRRYAEDHPKVKQVRERLAALERQLAEHPSNAQARLDSAKRQLAEMRTKHSEEHPAMKELRARIMELEREVANRTRRPRPWLLT
jgi:hypothetical protein